MSPKLAWQYGGQSMVEYEYAPNGVPSDECLADTASTPIQGPNFYVPTLTVALEPCGITAQSLWILDQNNLNNGYVNLINAGYATASSYDEPESSSTNANLTSPFAEPDVLTVNSSGKVVLAPLSEIGGVVSPTQMWASWSSQPVRTARRAKIAKR